MIGTSRKRFLGSITGREVGDRIGGTIASNVLALAAGADVFRVHDVAELRQALDARGGPRPREWRAMGAERSFRSWSRTASTSRSVQVELRGLSIYTHHGVTDAEQEIGQRLVIDVSFDVPDCDAVLTDRIEDTIDYSEVSDIVALAATERSYRTLERLAAVIGERLMERFGSDSVRVRAAKPEPPIPVAIEEVAVEVVRDRALADLERGGGPGGRDVTLRLPRARIERRRPARAPARRARAALRATGWRSRRPRPSTRPSRWARSSTSPTSSTRRSRSTPTSSPRQLLDVCKAIEVERGRLFGGPRHGPRPLDVDLLLLGELELATERLTLPHPRGGARRFVLVPLLELDPALALPDGTRAERGARGLGGGAVERVGTLVG